MKFFTLLENSPRSNLKGFGSFDDPVLARTAQDHLKEIGYNVNDIFVYVSKIEAQLIPQVKQNDSLYDDLIGKLNHLGYNVDLDESPIVNATQYFSSASSTIYILSNLVNKLSQKRNNQLSDVIPEIKEITNRFRQLITYLEYVLDYYKNQTANPYIMEELNKMKEISQRILSYVNGTNVVDFLEEIIRSAN